MLPAAPAEARGVRLVGRDLGPLPPLTSPASVAPRPRTSSSPRRSRRCNLPPGRDPTVITVKQWDRLERGALYASASRLDWATLLRRTHGIDALVRPACEGRLRPIATITDLAVARKILVHLGHRADPLPRARARDPTGQESFDFDAA